jgi:formylglycine-generating enzyme required for sulfatase activity
VEQVSWDDAQQFVYKLNMKEGRYVDLGGGIYGCPYQNSCYSLPTEAQWEYAARAGTVTAFYNGDITHPTGNDPNLNEIGWYWMNSGGITHPVAQKKANSFGLYDMAGNVYEWCYDWYGTYPDGPVTDPTGTAPGYARVIRGGSCDGSAWNERSAYRQSYTPGIRAGNLGFRLVMSVEP